jgi:signal transduction histidine kinase
VTKLRRWLQSLQTQLILWAVLPITLVAIGLALTGVYTHQQAMLDFVVERDRILVDLVALRLEEALVRGELAPDGSDLSGQLPSAIVELPGTLLVLSEGGQLLAQGGRLTVEAREAQLALDSVSTGASSVVTSDTGESVIIATAEVPGVRWQVVTWVLADDLIGPILRFSSLGPIAAAVAAVLAVLVLVFGWRTIVHPLLQLSHAAEEVSWGDRTALQLSTSGVTEIQDLHAALAHMVERLEGYQAGVLDYLDAVTQGQEEERARLAHELHDGPVQSLLALAQRTEMLRIGAADDGMPDIIPGLDALRDAGIEIVDDLRRIIGAIRPAYLEDLGFLPALEALVQSADARDETVVQLKVETDIQRMPSDLELAAYRIIQEALANALQHANAKRIDVTVRFDPDRRRDGEPMYGRGRLNLRVADDGHGFEPATHLDGYTREGHFGLVGLQERVRQLNGTFTIASAPGVGTVVDVRLPLPEAA